MPKPTKTIEEIIITHLQRVDKPFATRRARVDKWHAKQLAALNEKRRVALDAIDTVEAAELDAILVGHPASKADALLVAAGLRVDAGIEAVEAQKRADDDSAKAEG